MYYHYRKLPVQTDSDLLLNELPESVRLKRGQNKQAGAGIMDSPNVRCGNNRSLNGIEGNKKVKGIKGHVIVDKNGFFFLFRISDLLY